jgi:hypothetical protein
MSLLDFLRPQGAQMPGMAQQPSGLARILQPEVALPMAAALLGNQGNMQNFGNAFGAAGPALMQQKELQAQTAKDNKTYEFFKTQAPEYAQLIDAGMPVKQAWQTYTQQRFAKEKGQGIINAGAGNLYNSETNEWLSAPGGGVEGVAGLTPVWLRDEETGKPVLGQMRKDGTVVRSGMPDGTSAVGPYDVNFDRAAGTAAGKGTGEAAVALPGVQQMAGKVSQQVEDLKADPYLSRMLGPVDSRLPNVTADAARVQSKIAQLTGEAFLSARQALKGGGAITDYEGQKAEAALARLNQAQSVEDFNAALDEFNYHVQLGLHLLQQQAGKQRMEQGTPGAPVDYKSKYGLD